MKRPVWIALSLAALMLMVVGCDREVTGDVELADNSSQDCLQCHSGYLDQAQGEWANSIHASGTSIDYTNRDGSDCMACHDQEGFVALITTGELPDAPLTTVSAIGCFTCHDPHENGDMRLRTTAAYTLMNGDVFDHGQGNLCANCHHSRVDVREIGDDESVNSRYGPHHGPQGDLINGSGGYEFPGLSYTFASSPHAGVVRDACIGCHMGDVQQHDGYDIGGHSWNMVAPEDEEVTLAKICADPSCHPSATSYDFRTPGDVEDYDGDGNTTEGYQSEIEGLLEELHDLLVAQGVLNAGTGAPNSGTIADGHLAGALYNYVTVEEDRSVGVHNFVYISSLLEASIDYVEGLAGASSMNVATVQASH